MKKKFFLGLLVVLVLFVFTGCNKKGGSEDTPDVNPADESVIIDAKIDGEETLLRMTYEFYDMYYKCPDEVTVSSLGLNTVLEYVKDNKSLLKVDIGYLENTKLADAVDTTELKKTDTKTFNKRKWTVYTGKYEDGNKVTKYAYQHGEDTYTVTFISEKDYNEFMKPFMSGISFR